MSLQDRLNEQKQKQSTIPATGNSSKNIQLENELSEVKKQNNLLRERMIEIENAQDERNQRIDGLLEKLEKGTTDWNSRVRLATEKVSSDLLQTQKRAYERIEESLKEQNKLSRNFYKIKGYSLMTLHVIAMILLIGLIARTLYLGIWDGLFLSHLFALEEWYWSLLAIGIVVVLVGGIIALIIKGISEMRY